MPAYGPLDKLLHRLALQLAPVAELSFDLDQRIAGADPQAVATERHVFVSGLARAGTTVLMRRLHASGAFRSLTYRDMPFVLAPNLWRKLVAGRQCAIEKAERAHGDGVLVDADSPESFDEVFWRIFAGDAYLGKTELTPHRPEPEVVTKLVRYVAAILAAQEGDRRRYLSKNNNNVLRLDAIRQAFPNALILVPVREPLAQAASLERQHRLFSSLQKEVPFARAYMRWLGHHEFGLEHRPFRFTGAASGAPRTAVPETVDYWLEIWAETYAWLERAAPIDAVFVIYEDLCDDPAVWRHLAKATDIDPLVRADEPFRSSNRGPAAPVSLGELADNRLVDRSTAIYERLRKRARIAPA